MTAFAGLPPFRALPLAGFQAHLLCRFAAMASTTQSIVIAAGLELLLLAILLLCRRWRIPPIPIRLPSLAILIWLLVNGLSAAVSSGSTASWLGSLQRSSSYSVWLETVLQLSRAYALPQLISWLALDLPSVLPWWPRPAKILKDLVLLVIASAITLVVIQQLHQVNLVGLITTSAILTAVIGLAAQESLKDFFAGIVLQIDSPFQEGDYIDVGDDANGWVISLTLMSTRIQHDHGALITLPNSRIWGANIRRFSPRGPIAREIHLTLDRAIPPDQASALLLQVASRHPLVLKQPEPEAFVFSYADHGITYELEVWQEDPSDNGFDILRGQLLAQIWYSLERIGRTLPYPVRELRQLQLPEQSGDPAGFEAPARLELLRRNALFQQLEPSQLQTIAPLTRCLRFARGETVVVEGDAGQAMFQVVNGSLEVLKQMPGGEDKVVAQLGEGVVFGEMSVFSEEPRSATVRAQRECVLLEIERDDLRPLLEGNPQLVDSLAQLISERRAQLNKLSQASKEAQGNQLLMHMRQMFLSLKGA